MDRGRPSPEQQEYEHMLKANVDFKYKFNLFMTALIFAILSFAIQHPIRSETGKLLKLIEVISWIILFLSGYFSLVVCSQFPVGILSRSADKLRRYFNKDWTDLILMWRLFYFSLFLLLLVKGIERFI